MKFGFIPIEGGAYYPQYLEQVELGEALGFDSVWLEEHHGVKDHYWPSPLLALAGAATRTERISLGTDILVAPFYHPVRLAEDVALLDIISKGRLILGMAIGYKPDEFDLYQVPFTKRGERFEEALCLMKQLWTQDAVTFEGKYYQVKGQRIEPKPYQRPHPPLWLGGWGKLSLTRAAFLGQAWIPGPTADLAKLLEAQKIYHTKLESMGIMPGSRPTPLTRDLVIAKTDEEAWEMAKRHLSISYRDEYATATWSHPLLSGGGSASIEQFEDFSKDRFLIGDPDTVIQQIQRFEQAFGVDHLICRLYFPGMPHDFILQELKLFAAEVIPAFKGEGR